MDEGKNQRLQPEGAVDSATPYEETPLVGMNVHSSGQVAGESGPYGHRDDSDSAQYSEGPRRPNAGVHAGERSRVARKAVYRRRIAVGTSFVVVVLLIVSLIVYFVPSLRGGLFSAVDGAQDNPVVSSSGKVGARKRRMAKSADAADRRIEAGASEKRSEESSSKEPRMMKVAGGEVTALPRLTDTDRVAILAKAQEAAVQSGKPRHDYSYCVATRGAVSDLVIFENTIFRTLNDPRGWTRAGATFTYSADSSRCDMVLYLSQSDQITSFSPDCSNEYSCRVGQAVIVNDDRWNGGTPQWLAAGGTMDRYRVMVINHEVGHRLGHMDNEPFCSAPGQPAPLMQEQSMNLGGCTTNEWPTDVELWISQ